METQLNRPTITKILLLEDDVSLIDGLEYSLQKNGFPMTAKGLPLKRSIISLSDSMEQQIFRHISHLTKS